MECNKGFSASYMILKPEEVGFFDLMHILFSSDMEKRKFVDSSEATEESFGRRWLIFLSIVAQKTLQFGAKPLASVGSGFEMGLNLLSSNGNLFKLILNFIRGRVVIPDKTSPSFYSFIGNLDKRPKLDTNIKHGDLRYNAALSMMASKISYENAAHIEHTVTQLWEMEFLGFYDYWNDYQEKATTQVFMMRDKAEDHETIVVAFRGTEPFDADAWCSDFDISWYEIPGVGKIHGGFMKALGLQKCIGWPNELDQDDVVNRTRPAPLAYYAIREKLRELLKQNDKAKYVLTGHSLGGALAILFPAVLAFHDEKWLLERLEGVYTFGQPRVGDETFGEFMKKEMVEHDIRYFRFVYGNDMVPRLPYDDKALMFKHFGTCIYSNRHYQLEIVEEEPNKNYFSPLKAIPMMVNAFGELVRSFTLPRRSGADYIEGSFLRLFRIIGLVIPGVPAHCPQDYVNTTRLGSADVFLRAPKDHLSSHSKIL
ncbi:Fungal lipase-like domain containing protein [Trema orientale]|uniref:Fungal lipase-like domain containing protein n=1 Tax=Trema orientale TaxID=63057 RepID=A0A2P5FYD8_TREOI|nr:Fungal lipase-like domain containing protein [Trema orientale]